jgi:choline dehydrogenase-like flavoprotein
MKSFADEDEVDFAIVGTGAGGGTLACKLAEKGFSVVAFDAGPFWRPLDDFASDETEQMKLFWLDPRISAGDDALELGERNSGRGVGGSTVHFTMITLRFRPEWFKSRSRLGYGVDWPFTFDELEPYYEEAEQALKVSGPVAYPWGRRRGPYPYRPHEVAASGLVLARGAEAMGIRWAPVPLATVSAPRGQSPACVYRGFCNSGCSTNAKQSVLVVWIPRALAAGAEVRDMAMVGQVETNGDGRATGVLYHRQGRWRRQRARHVVVAGYSIETPRLLFNSATGRWPLGLANSSGMVGKHLMVQSSQGVWAEMPEEVRFYKGPPCMAVTEHWNYLDHGKDYHGGFAFMSQGERPMGWATNVASARGLWGMALREEMLKFNRMGGLKAVGEVEPRECNHVELADEADQYGLKIPRVTFAYSENDRRLMAHSVEVMSEMLEAAGGADLWVEDDASHLLGACRMGDDPETSVVDPWGRSWDIPNLWICDGSVFCTVGGVNPSLTIMALACRTADHIGELARRGEL